MVRTLPRSLAAFRKIVEERGQRFRKVPFEELRKLAGAPIEHLTVGSRPATIGVIVQPLPSGGLCVVIQGFMEAGFVGKHVALDGFYQYPDETIGAMPQEEFYNFD
jgi:hypothetical protein